MSHPRSSIRKCEEAVLTVDPYATMIEFKWQARPSERPSQLAHLNSAPDG